MSGTGALTALVGRWASASNDRAVANARAGSTALSRRRVEREDVALFLEERSEQRSGSQAG